MTQLEALKIIARRDNGVLTPNAVIEEARDEDSVLHGAFTWDDTEAAEKWRVHEAQKLIRSFYVETRTESGMVARHPAFINLSVDRAGKAENNPYRVAEDVQKHADLIECAVNDAMTQLFAIKARYEHLKQLGGVWSAIDAANKKVKADAKKVRGKAK